MAEKECKLFVETRNQTRFLNLTFKSHTLRARLGRIKSIFCSVSVGHGPSKGKHALAAFSIPLQIMGIKRMSPIHVTKKAPFKK